MGRKEKLKLTDSLEMKLYNKEGKLIQTVSTKKNSARDKIIKRIKRVFRVSLRTREE